MNDASEVPSMNTGLVIEGNSFVRLIVNVPLAGLKPGSDFGISKMIEFEGDGFALTSMIASRSVPPAGPGASAVVVTIAVIPDSNVRVSSRSPQG